MKKVFLILAMALSAATMGWAKTYNLLIMDHPVTDANKNDIMGNGMFSFDPATSTLTIHDGKMEYSFEDSFGTMAILIGGNAMLYDEVLTALTINVDGNAAIYCTAPITTETKTDGIVSHLPLTFKGRGRLRLSGFYGTCVKAKKDLTFESGEYFFTSGNNKPGANAANMEFTSHCIHQEGSDYKLRIKGGYFNLKTYSDLSTDRASVMRYDGGIDFSGIGRVDFISPETNLQEIRTDDNKYFSDLFDNKRYLSDVWYVSVGNIRRRGIQEAQLWPKIAPVVNADGTEFDCLINYYKKDGNVQFRFGENGYNYLVLNNVTLPLPQGILVNTPNLTVQCYGENTIKFSNTGYALRLPVSDSTLLFRGYTKNASLTITAPACIQSNRGFVVENMTLDCQATGVQAITISSASSKVTDHTITVRKCERAGDSPAKLHASSTQYPIYGVKAVAEGDIFKKGKVQNNVIVDQKGAAMTDVTIGYETTYPVQVNGEYLTPSLVELYQDKFGKANFTYDTLAHELAIKDINDPTMFLNFYSVNGSSSSLAIQGTSNLNFIYVDKSLFIRKNGYLNLNSTYAGILLGKNAVLTINGSATVNSFGTMYGICSMFNSEPGSLTIKNASATFKGNTRSVANIQSIYASESVLTAPTNASFSHDQNTIVVGGTPTTETVVYTRTDWEKPVYGVEAYVGEEGVFEADVKVGNVIELTAKVTGNGSAAGEFRWQVYSEEYGWIWLTTKQSITKAELINGKLMTEETTIAQSDPSQKLMRAVVTNSDGTETGISNVITLNALYQIFLQDDGYKYYLNGDKASAQSVTIGGGDNVWMHTYDTLYLEVDEDARECFMDFESDEFNIFGGENYVYYTYDVTSGRIDVTIRKLKIEFYSSRTQMDESTLVERIRYTDSKPVYCGSTLKSSSHFSPAAPKKTSPFVGWMDMSNQAIYDDDAVDTLELYDDKVFCAIYEEDITHYYQLLVNDVQVSSENCDDILSDGTASYDNGNKILTLNNASISNPEGYVLYIMQDMAIECLGANILSASGLNFEALCGDGGHVTIQGDGTLLVMSEKGKAILATDGLTIKGGCTVTAQSDNLNAIHLDDETLTIDGATLTAKGNNTVATIIGCDSLSLINASITSAHSFDPAQSKFLNNESEEAKDDIIFSKGSVTRIQEVGNKNEQTGVRKQMRNGQLIIIREGKSYNAQGTRL